MKTGERDSLEEKTWGVEESENGLGNPGGLWH